jgi:alkylated DNA repair dioxygenase AlkB
MFENHPLIELDKAVLLFIPQFFTPSVSEPIFHDLIHKIDWQQGFVHLFGKKIPEPRLTAWYGDAGKSYIYSGKINQAAGWIEPLLFLKQTVTSFLESNWSGNFGQVKFNSVLCNYYRTGQDSMGWHADDEPELGQNPLIASLNFGETRRFLFRKKADKKTKFELSLQPGSLLVMGGAMQHYWEHAVPKEPRRTQPRINLTFRLL